jgi:hypothetical protein
VVLYYHKRETTGKGKEGKRKKKEFTLVDAAAVNRTVKTLHKRDPAWGQCARVLDGGMVRKSSLAGTRGLAAPSEP